MKPSLVEIVLRRRAEQMLARVKGEVARCLICGRKLGLRTKVDVCMTCRLEGRRAVLAADGSVVEHDDGTADG